MEKRGDKGSDRLGFGNARADPIHNREGASRNVSMKGDMKLFTLRMDLKRAQQYKSAKATENTSFGPCEDASVYVKRMFLQDIPKVMKGIG
jgi:hypothetical protein